MPRFPADIPTPVTLTLNGRRVVHSTTPRRLLSDFLRHDIGATGTHIGCEHGVCGACTVIVDGAAVRSCLMLAIQSDGRDVTTVEGLGENPAYDDLRAAFRRHHALQCGFCTPGFLTTLAAWLAADPDPDDEGALRAVLSGTLCRCTGYVGIVDAAMETARARRDAREPADV